jgi:hypothetical protein
MTALTTDLGVRLGEGGVGSAGFCGEAILLRLFGDGVGSGSATFEPKSFLEGRLGRRSPK